MGKRRWEARARCAACVVVLNLLDGLFTLTFLQLYLAEEINPLMRLAYAWSPLAFMICKLATVQGGVLLLALHHATAAARIALQGAALLYGAIFAYHLTILAWLLLT